MKAFSRLGATVALAMVAGTTTARADLPDIGNGSAEQFFAAQAKITVTFLYSLAAADNDLYLFTSVGSLGNFLIASKGTAPIPGTGAPGSVTFNLSDYGLVIGNELIFGICTTNPSGGPGCPATRTAFYMGPASRNADGALHAAILSAADWNSLGFGATAPVGSKVFGFENRTAGDSPKSDWDYNDLVFAVQGLSAPEPATMVLLATGLVGLSGAGLIRRRRRSGSS